MEFSFADYNPVVYLVIACGVFMAWGIGANDFSNSAGPAVGARILSAREAIFIVVIFELAGALLYGANVTETLGRKIIDLSIGDTQPMILVHGMTASLLAAGIWLTFASFKGWPVSTTHSIVGAIVGFALAGIGMDAVNWEEIGRIVVSWVVCPAMGGLLAYVLMKSMVLLVLKSRDPVRSARRWVPLYVFLAGFLICRVTFANGIRHLNIELSDMQSSLLAGFFGLVIAGMCMLVVRERAAVDIERTFAPITIFTVCAMAFAHGSNDVANSVGPMTLAMEMLRGGDGYNVTPGFPLWLFLLAGAGIALGVATFGFRVIRTVGHEITTLSPCRAFIVTLASTATVVLASGGGLPVSTTHTVIGAVLGVGLAGGTGAIHFSVVKRIVDSWLFTLPLTALMAALIFFVLRALPGS